MVSGGRATYQDLHLDTKNLFSASNLTGIEHFGPAKEGNFL